MDTVALLGHEASQERGNVKLRYLVVGVLVGVMAFGAVALAGGGGPKTKLVSRANNGDPGTGGYSAVGGITPNGRWVSMESAADNFPGASAGEDQVYVRDRKRGRTILVSRANNGDPADGGGSYDTAISDNGRFVAFESNATNLPGSLGPTYYQLYVRDLRKGKTQLISRLGGGDPATGGDSTDASISGNGRLVAFESDASNLPGTLSPDDQVYLKDRKTGALKLIGKTTGGTPANDDTEDPAISQNGRIVGFESLATNLPGGLGTADQSYVRDLRGGRTLLVSRNSAGDPANNDTEDVTLSANGRFVEFESEATNLPGSLGPTYTQVYLRDRKRGKTELISKTTGGDPATGYYSEDGSVSANGRWVQFESGATNLPGQISPDYQVYLRDRDKGNTKLVSKSNSGDPGDDTSGMRMNSRYLSRDPRFSAFFSYATNLPGSNGPTYNQAYVRGPSP
jgi:Tol biopolymer transport system component